MLTRQILISLRANNNWIHSFCGVIQIFYMRIDDVCDDTDYSILARCYGIDMSNARKIFFTA